VNFKATQEVDWSTCSAYIAIWNFYKMAAPPSWIWSNQKQSHSIRLPWKPHPRTKHEVDCMTRCGDMGIQNIPNKLLLLVGQSDCDTPNDDRKFYMRKYDKRILAVF